MKFNNALKVQGNLAQGNALGCNIPYSISPCKGRIKAAFTLPPSTPLRAGSSGRVYSGVTVNPGRCPGLR